MSHRFRLALLLTGLAFAGCDSASESDVAEPSSSATSAASYYSIDHYDPEADAGKDLAKTVERAAKERKRIILISGGDW